MKKGFTLIEVLTVLAILGIIAALLISSISKAGLKEQERNKFLLLKAYTNLAQNSEDILSNKQNFPRGLLAQSHATNTTKGRQLNFCDEFISTINTLGDMKGDICNCNDVPAYSKGGWLNSADANGPYSDNYCKIVSSDKMVWWGIGGTAKTSCPTGQIYHDPQLENKNCDGSFSHQDIDDGIKQKMDSPNSYKIITVDVNGTEFHKTSNQALKNTVNGRVDKSKNIFGLDIFRFKLYNDGRVELMDDPLFSPYRNRRGERISTARALLKDANPTNIRNNRGN